MVSLENDPFWKYGTKRGEFGNNKHNHAYFRGALPPIDTLPLPIQTLLDNIKDLPAYEKMSLIHDFVSDNMKSPDNKREIYGADEPCSSLLDTLKQWRYGDCDDKAKLSLALLRYAGFDEESITYFMADAYHNRMGGSGHAVLVVVDEEQHYVLDPILKDVVPLHANKNGTFTALGSDRQSLHNDLIERTLVPLAIIPIDENNNRFVSQKLIDRFDLNSQSETSGDKADIDMDDDVRHSHPR